LLEGFVGEFRRLFSGLRLVLVATHPNADPDALASAVIALRVLEALGSSGCIGLPEGLSKVSKAIVDRLSLNLRLCSVDVEPEGCVVVDSSNPVQLGLFGERCLASRARALIDHHEPGLLSESFDLKLVDPKASSTTELLVLMADLMGLRLDSRDATLAAAGIVYDSRRFTNIGPYTFKAMSLLLEWGCDYSEALKSMSVERGEVEDLSRRVAVLKALSRMKLERACNDLLVVVTHIGSYESEVARTLVNLGVDVGVVVADRGEKARVSIRLSERALEKGLKASIIASYIASKYRGEGGGHDRAAMAHISLEEDVERVVDGIARSLPGKIGRMCQSQDVTRQEDSSTLIA